MEIKIPIDGGFTIVYILDEELRERYRQDPDSVQRQFQTYLNVAFEYLAAGPITRDLLDRLEEGIAESRAEIIKIGCTSDQKVTDEYQKTLRNLKDVIEEENGLENKVNTEDKVKNKTDEEDSD